MDIKKYFGNIRGTIKKYIDQLKRKSTTIRGCLCETALSLQNLDETKQVIENQNSKKAEEIVAQVLAQKDELLAELNRTVSTSIKNLEIEKSDLELYLVNTENLSKWAHAIIEGGPSSGAEISKDLLNQLKKCSEAEPSSTTLSTPVFTPSRHQLPATNLIGSLNTSEYGLIKGRIICFYR
jgi:hypothetical protein